LNANETAPRVHRFALAGGRELRAVVRRVRTEHVVTLVLHELGTPQSGPLLVRRDDIAAVGRALVTLANDLGAA
jgi:hypothetical protein